MLIYVELFFPDSFENSINKLTNHSFNVSYMRLLKTTVICFFLCYSWAYADNPAMSQEQVRQLVEELLQSKSAEMARMNHRINELEKLTRDQKKLIQQLQTGKSINQRLENNTNEQPVPFAVVEKTPQSLASFLFPDTTAASESNSGEYNGSEISGFFDTTAQTKNGSNQIFHIGVVELDLDRIFHKGDFAASIALDWFPYGTAPNAQIGAAFVDFHLYDESIPVRGRIFQEPGFHIQVGQFDLPFGSDYQYFAVTDRLTVTPPMTTTRIQQSGINPANGGFNSPGIRTYGKWRNLTYAVYAIDSIFSNGLALGTRIGFSMNSPFQLHKPSEIPLLDFGLSYLNDMDQSEHTTDQLYAFDLSFNYQNFRLSSEYVHHNSKANRNDGNPVLNESAFHVTLLGDLQQWLHEDLYVYSRYQQWRPGYASVNINGSNFQIGFIPAVSVGMGYHLNDFLTFKIEYTDTLGHRTAEPTFQTQTGIAQLVGAF